MKRLLIFSFFLAFVSLGIHAQLPRTFYGATLGETTKHQAIQTLLAQKADIASNLEESLFIQNVTFDGVTFNNMSMHFYDDVLYKIYFYDQNKFDYSKHRQLEDKYTNLYSPFKYHSMTQGAFFDDDVIELTITDEFVFFRDMKMQKKEEQEHIMLNRQIHPYTSTRISQTILGSTLGVSTKQQVTSAVKALGCKAVQVKKQNGEDKLFFTGLTYEGINFPYISAVFVEGKLAQMMFLRPGEKLSQYEVNTLIQYFDSQYSAYKIQSTSNSPVKEYGYDDDRIVISFSVTGLSFVHHDLFSKETRRLKRLKRGKIE